MVTRFTAPVPTFSDDLIRRSRLRGQPFLSAGIRGGRFEPAFEAPLPDTMDRRLTLDLPPVGPGPYGGIGPRVAGVGGVMTAPSLIPVPSPEDQVATTTKRGPPPAPRVRPTGELDTTSGPLLTAGIGSDVLNLGGPQAQQVAAPAAQAGGISSVGDFFQNEQVQSLGSDLISFGGALAAGDSPYFAQNFGNALLNLQKSRAARSAAAAEFALAKAGLNLDIAKAVETTRHNKATEALKHEEHGRKSANSEVHREYMKAQIDSLGADRFSKTVETSSGIYAITKGNDVVPLTTEVNGQVIQLQPKPSTAESPASKQTRALITSAFDFYLDQGLPPERALEKATGDVTGETPGTPETVLDFEFNESGELIPQ